ncbi:hypothetical protein JCM11641_008404 [Rhodosporidiobolus odoratus]
MDIDDIFKRPPLPKSSISNPNKRKLDQPELDPESYKSVKLDSSTAPGSTRPGRRAAGGVTIEDVQDQDGGNRGEFAPNGDADYFEEEDEDGRFYGGGLSTVQKQVLNIMNRPGSGREGGGQGEGEGGVDQLPGEDLTPQSVRKQLLNLEKAVNKNRDLRTKFPDDPEKFVDSEFNLLESLNALLLLSVSPALTYPILLENATPSTLADLLSHENTDVAIAVIQVLEEWVDPEGLEGDEAEEDEGEDERKRAAVKGLVDSLVKEGVRELVTAQLARLNEEDEGERTGVFHALSLVENLLTLSPTLGTSFLSPSSFFLSYLLNRLSSLSLPSQDQKKKLVGPEYDQNRFYAAEMLALVLSLPWEVVEGVREARMRVAQEDKERMNGVDKLLKVISVYRKRDPTSGEEQEFLENCFDALCSCLSSPLPPAPSPSPSSSFSSSSSPPHPVKKAFLTGEGLELLLLLLKSTSKSKTNAAAAASFSRIGAAIKALDHALQGRPGAELCERFVEVLGLGSVFKIFMGKTTSTKSSTSTSSASAANLTHETTTHLLSLLASLFSSLPSDSPSRLRLISKFIENDYEKLDRLDEVREELENRIARNTGRGGQEEEPDEDEVYLEKLEGGLFGLQMGDYVAGWVCMEDDGAREHLSMLLSRRGKSLKDLVEVLVEYRDNIGDDEEGAVETQQEGESGGSGEGEDEGQEMVMMSEGEERKAILDQLARYLESVA